MKALAGSVACILLLSLAAAQATQSPSTTAQTGPQAPSRVRPATSSGQVPQRSSSTATQTYRITGKLVNSVTQQPVAGASVAIAPVNTENEHITQSLMTSSDGQFSFSGLHAGKYSLMAAGRGFTLQYFEHHDEYATAIAVGPDLNAEHLVFRLEPDAAIDGQISDENGDPVQTAQVRLFQRTASAQGKTTPLEQTQSDDQGRYHIGHLLPGTYYLAVSARPWYAQNNRLHLRRNLAATVAGQRAIEESAALDVTYPLTFYPDSPDSAGASPILLHAGERANADVVLHAVPSLHLRIHTGNAANDGTIGRSVFPRVSLRVLDGYLDPVFNAPVSWQQAGLVEISGLAPGHYLVEMPAEPGNPGEKSTGRSWYQDIDLVSDAEITAADSPGFPSVSGVITFQGIAHIPAGAALRLQNRESGETFSTGILKNGQFVFQNEDIRPGRYELTLETGQRFFLSRLSATGARITGRTLEITGAGKVRIIGSASRGVATVTGTALRADQPYAGAMIVLVPQDPANNAPLFRRDQSDSDGSFTLANVVPGQYTLLALADGWNIEWANPAALQPYFKAGVPIQVTGDGELQTKVQVQ